MFFQPDIPAGISVLNADESRHCIRVLRKREGDSIRITDGHGKFYDAVITKANPSACEFRITGEEEAGWRTGVHIAISPTKNADRIEWFVEKVVEIGVDRITLMRCDHSERTVIKTDRLRKVAISAMKQSVKAILPEISELVPFSAVVKDSTAGGRFIAYVDPGHTLHLKDALTPDVDCCILIGPEGDFSPTEINLAREHGFRPVSLGPSRLRTETAGVVACVIANL